MIREDLTDFFTQLTAEATEHARRHGFAEHEDYEGLAFIGDNAHRDAVFQPVAGAPGLVIVEVLGMAGSVSVREIDAQRFVGLSDHPDAAFMDALEEALVDAKRHCSC